MKGIGTVYFNTLEIDLSPFRRDKAIVPSPINNAVNIGRCIVPGF